MAKKQTKVQKARKAVFIKDRVEIKKAPQTKEEKMGHKRATYSGLKGVALSQGGQGYQYHLSSTRRAGTRSADETYGKYLSKYAGASLAQGYGDQMVYDANKIHRDLNDQQLNRSLKKAGVKGKGYHTAILGRPAVKRPGKGKARVKYKK